MQNKGMQKLPSWSLEHLCAGLASHLPAPVCSADRLVALVFDSQHLSQVAHRLARGLDERCARRDLQRAVEAAVVAPAYVHHIDHHPAAAITQRGHGRTARPGRDPGSARYARRRLRAALMASAMACSKGRSMRARREPLRGGSRAVVSTPRATRAAGHLRESGRALARETNKRMIYVCPAGGGAPLIERAAHKHSTECRPAIGAAWAPWTAALAPPKSPPSPWRDPASRWLGQASNCFGATRGRTHTPPLCPARCDGSH